MKPASTSIVLWITSGEWKRCQGRIATARIDAMKPPRRQVIFEGARFEMSKAAETKFATTFTPTVATSSVKPKRSVSIFESSFPKSWIGSMMSSPKMTGVPEIVITAIEEKKTKLIGSPQKLPQCMSRSERQ